MSIDNKVCSGKTLTTRHILDTFNVLQDGTLEIPNTISFEGSNPFERTYKASFEVFESKKPKHVVEIIAEL